LYSGKTKGKTMSSQDDPDRTYKILVVEDDPIDAELVSRYLGQSRRPRFTAESVQYLKDAMEALNSKEFDAVLLDLNLPDSFGLEAVDRLRASWTAGPIIVLTGLDEECIGTDALRHGAQDYLAKDGLSGHLLSRSIRYAIERHNMSYWISVTERSKDDYLAEVCNSLQASLSELLIATSDLSDCDESLQPKELEQVSRIMQCSQRMSDLIENASPTAVTTVTAAAV